MGKKDEEGAVASCYYGHSMRKQGSCLEKEIMQGTMSGARRRGRPRTACIDVYRRGLPVKESIRMTEDRYKWRKDVHGVANDTIRYDTRCYFNVRSKADISQLNLPHGTDN